MPGPSMSLGPGKESSCMCAAPIALRDRASSQPRARPQRCLGASDQPTPNFRRAALQSIIRSINPDGSSTKSVISVPYRPRGCVRKYAKTDALIFERAHALPAQRA